MVYKIRLKARQKQAECSPILFLSFFVLMMTVLSFNLLPLVYNTAVRSLTFSESKAADLFVSAAVLMISVIICSALSFGCDRFMLKRAEDTVAGAGDIFYYFAPLRLLRLCGFLFLLLMRKFILLVFLMLPCSLCAGVFYSMCVNGFSALVCSIFALFTALFFILALVTFSGINDTCFTVKYRYIKGDYINFRHLFSDSRVSMHKDVRRLRKMKLSFTGWFMLCIFIVPIPYVWSYYRQSKACFAAECISL